MEIYSRGMGFSASEITLRVAKRLAREIAPLVKMQLTTAD